MMKRYMYLRPGNLFKDFIIEGTIQKVTKTGRVVSKQSGDGSRILKGCLAQASDSDRKNHSTTDHVVTHTIVQAGGPMAKRGDRLIRDERKYYIVDIDDAGDLGIGVIYYVDEREDL